MGGGQVGRTLSLNWPLWFGLGAQFIAQVALGAWFFATQNANIQWHEVRIIRLEAQMEIVRGQQNDRGTKLATIETKLDRVISDVSQILRKSQTKFDDERLHR